MKAQSRDFNEKKVCVKSYFIYVDHEADDVIMVPWLWRHPPQKSDPEPTLWHNWRHPEVRWGCTSIY